MRDKATGLGHLLEPGEGEPAPPKNHTQGYPQRSQFYVGLGTEEGEAYSWDV
jgi:hypothetical protein